MINGYKMLKDTPVRSDTSSYSGFPLSSDRKSLNKFRLPETPVREEIGTQIANQAMLRKREKKASEKLERLKHLGVVSKMASLKDCKNISNLSERSYTPSSISVRSGSSSIRSMMTPKSFKSGLTIKSQRSHAERRTSKFSDAGKKLLSKIISKR